MKASLSALSVLILTGFLGAGSVQASTCTSTGSGVTRTWMLDLADSCGTLGGNPNQSSDIVSLGGDFDGAPAWTKLGDITSSADNSTYLNVGLTSGVWGSNPVAGTWTLAPAFWAAYGEAVIHIHVGGNPDNLPDETGVFFVHSSETSGAWSFTQNPTTGAGGGLSNLTLWGRGPGTPPGGGGDTPAPAPGVLALLGLGMAGLAVSRRKRS